MEAIAHARFQRHGTRKVAQVLAEIRGKSVLDVQQLLPMLPRACVPVVAKTVQSAAANLTIDVTGEETYSTLYSIRESPLESGVIWTGSNDGVFAVTNLPSYRLSIDMANPDAAQIVQTTGQSGNPFDRHYGDLIDDWLAGRTVPLPFTQAAVSESAVETLQLVPRAGG